MRGNFWTGVLVGMAAMYFWIYHAGDVMHSFEQWFNESASRFQDEEKHDAARDALR